MTQLDSSAIDKIQVMAATALGAGTVGAADCPAMIMPSDYHIQVLEFLENTRYRFRGVMKTTSIYDFVRYSIVHAKDIDSGVRCFINAEDMSASTIFNIGTLESPGHADNKATLELKKTAPYAALLNINGERARQKYLAEWLEDWRDHLIAFDTDNNPLDIKRAIGAVRRIVIEASGSADYEDADFSGKKSTMESIEAKSKDVMPGSFEFKCVPYAGLQERSFKLRYSILTGGDAPVLVLRIVRLESEEEAAANEFRDLLAEEFKGQPIETFIGCFQP